MRCQHLSLVGNYDQGLRETALPAFSLAKPENTIENGALQTRRQIVQRSQQIGIAVGGCLISWGQSHAAILG